MDNLRNLIFSKDKSHACAGGSEAISIECLSSGDLVTIRSLRRVV